jgi:hypothetical protein
MFPVRMTKGNERERKEKKRMNRNERGGEGKKKKLVWKEQPSPDQMYLMNASKMDGRYSTVPT